MISDDNDGKIENDESSKQDRTDRSCEYGGGDRGKYSRGRNGKGRFDDNKKFGRRDGNGRSYSNKNDCGYKRGRNNNGNYASRSNGDADAGSEAAPEKTTKVKLRLDVEDIVRNKPNAADAHAEPDDGITVLYEDNHILVTVKPQNIPTQADSSGDLDFLTMLKQYLIKKYNKPGDAYLGLLHRLDRPTGGVMIFAKTSKAAARLSEQIRGEDFEKTYAAVVSGKPNRHGLIEHYLFKDTQNNIVSVVPSSLEGAKKARSDIKVVEEKNAMALVSVKLLTGRTHQARVQLKALGSPIVGDTKYGGDKLIPSPHLALWAYKLAFIHPVSGDVMTFVAAPPQEFPWTEFNTDGLIDFVKPTDRNHYTNKI